jgi:hypothetical protein
MGGMTPDSFYNSQLFAFLFALGVFAIGVIVMELVSKPAMRRIAELDTEAVNNKHH